MTGDYILGILGIVVSVALFLIGYRQTVGAKKERLIAANAEIEKILVRRTVLEGYSPKIPDIERLTEGKARDFRVAPSDMLPPDQVLNTLFSRIVESDLIPQDRREEILQRILPATLEAESEPAKEQAVTDYQSRTRDPQMWGAGVGLAIGASILGALVSSAPGIVGLETIRELLPLVLGTLTASLVLISAFMLFTRVKESQETPIKVDSLGQYVQFEQEVARVIERAGGKIAVSSVRDAGYDFLVERDGKKILIEVKNWSRPMPAPIVRQVADRLATALEREKASAGLVVTASPVSSRLPEDSKVRVISLRELRNILMTHLKI